MQYAFSKNRVLDAAYPDEYLWVVRQSTGVHVAQHCARHTLGLAGEQGKAVIVFDPLCVPAVTMGATESTLVIPWAGIFAGRGL